MINYKDNNQKDDVNLILDAVIKDPKQSKNLDSDNVDIDSLYTFIYSLPITQRMEGDRAGKIAEFLLDIDPELLSKIKKLPAGFLYESDLEEINLPNTVESLGQGCFALSKLKRINYAGTEAEWEELLKNSERGWDVLNQGSGNGVYGKLQDSVIINCSDKENIYNIAEQIDEAMTRSEINIKAQIQERLREEGFVTFAEYLDNYHLNLVTSAQAGEPFAAAMLPDKGIIYINPTASLSSISILIRHEIGHFVFKHNDHFIAKLKEMGIDTPSQLAHELANKAGDCHIANQIYGDENDYYRAKHIKIKDSGLEDFVGFVTELDFPENPEYWTMDFDDLWDVFVKDYDPKELDAKYASKDDDLPPIPPEYAEAWNRVIRDYIAGKITKEDILASVNNIKESLRRRSLKEYFAIENPYEPGTDGYAGFEDALELLVQVVQGKIKAKQGQGRGGSKGPQLEMPPELQSQSNNSNNSNNPNKSNDSKNSKKSKDSTQQSGSTGSREYKPLTAEELEKLADEIEKMRDKTQDVIDDAGDAINQADSQEEGEEAQAQLAKAQEINKQLAKTGEDLDNAKTQADMAKVQARLQAIKTFWDDPEKLKDVESDRISRRQLIKLRKDAYQARLNALGKGNYPTMKLTDIVNSIVHTLRSQPVKFRNADYAHYNSRSADLGYAAPGRFTDSKKGVPDVLFYFDNSGSWTGDGEKIHTEHVIEESLKRLQNKEKKIKLSVKYFADTTDVNPENTGGGNSDAPVPDIKALLKAKMLDNVIIATDDNPQTTEDVIVPGFVWLLFYDTVSESFVQHIKGRKGTKVIMIEHEKAPEDPLKAPAEKSTKEVTK